ncbi:MAG TPA: HEPN domain-containing protein [Anaerolineae bacterium]|nr:HEPN domain-containing protein [Anaerolineae bacterium]HQI87237.1 HEPN domain-containing protein [Anaerolineae bacterium]
MSFQQDYIQYRLERAHEVLDIAKLAADTGAFNSCVNRLYYAMFYAVNALLFRHAYSSPKHTGVRALFNQHFIKTGLIPKEYGQLYNDLFELRQESDYKDFFYADPDEVLPLIPQVQTFIELVSKQLLPDQREEAS